MVIETASATVIKLSPPAKLSGPNTNQKSVSLAETGGQDLPLQGKKEPQVVQESSEIREAISEINEFVQSIQRDLSFNMDEASGRTVIRVIDRESGDLIRQIPSDEVLAIASHLRDVLENKMDQIEVPPGLLFSDST